MMNCKVENLQTCCSLIGWRDEEGEDGIIRPRFLISSPRHPGGWTSLTTNQACTVRLLFIHMDRLDIWTLRRHFKPDQITTSCGGDISQEKQEIITKNYKRNKESCNLVLLLKVCIIMFLLKPHCSCMTNNNSKSPTWSSWPFQHEIFQIKVLSTA